MVQTRSSTQRLKITPYPENKKKTVEPKRLKTMRNRIANISIDIISNILLEFSVKTLSGFKCVSKNWCKIIEDPIFIKRHFQHSKKHNKSNRFIIQAFDDRRGRFNTEFYSIGNGNSNSEPPHGKTNVLNMVSCDGLICLITGDNKIHVWNPATKGSVQLPKPKILRQTSYKTIMLGLGFDSCLRKYKVVCWELFGKDVQVLTVGAKSWRNMKCPYPPPSKRNGICNATGVGFPVYVNGTSHWYYDSKIVSFNFYEEKFGIVSLPKDHEGESSSKIFEVGGCLCLVVKESIDVVVKMWVLENYDKQEWVHKQVILPRFDMPKTVVMLVRDGEILIETRMDFVRRQYLCAYNEEGCVTNSLRINAIKDGYCHPCQSYTESLTRCD